MTETEFMNRVWIPLIAMSLVCTGCQGIIAGFLQTKRTIEPVIPFEGSTSIKVSPGNTTGQSEDVTLKAHITITDRLITGSDVADRVSINTSPKNQ